MHLMSQSNAQKLMIVAVSTVVIAMAATETQAQVAWTRPGFDAGNTHVFPVTATPNSGKLFTHLNDSSLKNPIVLTADLDGDGVVDIIACDGTTIKAMKGNGRVLWQKSYGTTSHMLNYIGDIDGDKKPEIFLAFRQTVAGKRDLAIEILNHDGSLNKIIRRNTPTTTGGTGMLVIGHQGSVIIAGYDMDHSPRGVTFIDYKTSKFSDYLVGGAYWGGYAIGDLNRNGKLDVALPWGTPHNGNSTNGTTDSNLYTVVLEANKTGIPTGWSTIMKKPLYSKTTSGILGAFMPDLNGDGIQELFFLEGHSSPYTGTNYLIRFNTKGQITGRWSAFSNRARLIVTVVDDITKDGVRELAVSGSMTDGVYLVDGAKLTTIKSSVSAGMVMGAASITGSASKQLICYNNATQDIQLVDAKTLALISRKNVGGFRHGTGKASMFAIGDVTGNGRLEIILGGTKGLTILDTGDAWFLRYAKGCGRSGGPVLLNNFGQLPRRNSSFGMTVSNLPIGPGGAFLMIGAGETNPPLSLTPIGMTGCNLHLDSRLGLSLFPCSYLPIGIASISFQIPNRHGLKFYAQAIALDSKANNAGLVLSNAVVGVTNR